LDCINYSRHIEVLDFELDFCSGGSVTVNTSCYSPQHRENISDRSETSAGDFPATAKRSEKHGKRPQM
jgi:hypothetical protein